VQLDKRGGWEQEALVPPAITREEGCGDTARALIPVLHPCSHVLKLHTTTRTAPSLQLPPSREEKTRKLEARASQDSISSSRLQGTWQVTLGSHPLAVLPQRARPPQPKGNEVTKVIVSVSDWAQNSCSENKKREKGDRERSRGGEGQRGTARRPQKYGRGGAGAHATLTHTSISEEFPGKINAKSVIKVYLRVRERASAPDYGIEMSLCSCICLTQFYLVAFCTISCSFCCWARQLLYNSRVQFHCLWATCTCTHTGSSLGWSRELHLPPSPPHLWELALKWGFLIN